MGGGCGVKFSKLTLLSRVNFENILKKKYFKCFLILPLALCQTMQSGNIVFDKNIMKHSLAFAQLYILFILFTSLTFYKVGKDGFKISIA